MVNGGYTTVCRCMDVIHNILSKECAVLKISRDLETVNLMFGILASLKYWTIAWDQPDFYRVNDANAGQYSESIEAPVVDGI